MNTLYTPNIWQIPADAICITTNGIVKNNGELVMGKGIALEAAIYMPALPRELGQLVSLMGNHTYLTKCSHEHRKIISFPTKYHWKDPSSLALISESADWLTDIIVDNNFKKVLLPAPGCGNGGLKWEDVEPILNKYLDERVIVVFRSKNVDI